MEQQVMKGIRLPLDVIQRIEKLASEDHSTFSQFIRTAAIQQLKRKERRGAGR